MPTVPGYALLLVLAVLAAARLTRLITADSITAEVRAAVIRRYGPRSNAAELISCAWCVGWWAAVLVVGSGALALHSGRLWWWAVPAAMLAVGYLVGLLAALDRG